MKVLKICEGERKWREWKGKEKGEGRLRMWGKKRRGGIGEDGERVREAVFRKIVVVGEWG
jgi:hypothetical protein